MHTELIAVTTGSRETVHDLTDQCEAFVADADYGLLHVFVPHATAGIAISGFPGISRPSNTQKKPTMPALIPPYATVPVIGGRLALGTWQSICLVDLNVDNPHREVRLSFIAG